MNSTVDHVAVTQFLPVLFDGRMQITGMNVIESRSSRHLISIGTSDASVKRGFVKLRETCKEKTNFYVEEELHPEVPPPPRSAVPME
jgi:hypothetical protein